MADFQQTREDLKNARAAAERAKLNLFASGQRLKMLETQLASMERGANPNGEGYLRQKAQLELQIRNEQATRDKHNSQYGDLKEKASEFGKIFELFLDPQLQLADHFQNSTPFLLFPLRIETRFKQVGERQQLWVRVYPDECLVDSFEPLLSQKEVNNAARFWAEYYSAGKPVDLANPDAKTLDLQKAAWAIIVKAHGAGRAAWITRNLKPDEAQSLFPLRSTDTVILSIIAQTWNAADTAPVTNFFRNLWLADGQQDKVDQVKQQFNLDNPALDADSVMASFAPVNFDEKPPTGVKRGDADLKIAIVVFPDLDKVAGKEHGWSQASRVNLMPERLALILFKGEIRKDPIFGNRIPFPLYTSPDPNDTDAQFQKDANGDLVFGDQIKWVADFDMAIASGLGFKIDLAQDEIGGFSKLMVLGVKLGADKAEGKKELQDLFDHQFFTKKGFSIIPQGTPTNNTDTTNSGYTYKDTPDETFDLYFKEKPAYTFSSNWQQKKDGQWLSEWLGIDYNITEKLLGAGGADQADARNMNTALWPGTMGYVMESMMKGGFSDAGIAKTREFFTRFVSGRGPIPAIRIGSQPYGILPTTAFSRLRWMTDRSVFNVRNFSGDFKFIADLYQLLLRLDNFWRTQFVNGVSHVAAPGPNAYQTLLDVLNLHPNSVSFHRRYLETLIEMSNAMSLIKPGFKAHAQQVTDTINLLHATLGYPTDILPQMAALLALPNPAPIKFLVDDQPLSETASIRSYSADNKNYLQILAEHAKISLDAIRTGKGLTERPLAELYRLLKFAIEQGYHQTGVNAAASLEALPATQLATMRIQQPFAHQQYEGTVQESSYAFLYNKIPAISATKTVAEFVSDSILQAVVPTYSEHLAEQVAALNDLKDASTARLERAMVEHLDTCTYRLDSWKTGIVTTQLALMRDNSGIGDQQQNDGIFLGAFGWVENVQPDRSKRLSVKQLPQDMQEDFNADGSKVFLSDSSNDGYIHAPSLNQAVTSAVLRNGYVSHGKPDRNNVLSVDLTSKRIRLALAMIEGVQGGQNLAALLGYQFERELHDRDDLKAKKIDSFIYPLRKKFPLAADQLKETNSAVKVDPSVDPDTIPITALEARNVIHGIHLIDHVKKQTIPANQLYPFGLTGLPVASPDIAMAITDAVTHIMNAADAVADLGMAESVHHVLMGNTERAAGVLDSYSKGNYPQEPDVTRTPRSGATLTHRVGLPLNYVALNAAANVRTQTEPSLAAWLTGMLPAMANIICNCNYDSRADNATKSIDISMSEIGLDAIDLVYILNATDASALTEIDDRLSFFIHANRDPKIGTPVKLNYTADPPVGNKLSLFQVMPFINSLRTIVLQSANLNPGDIAMPNEVSKKDVPAPELPVQRVTDLLARIKTIMADAAKPAGILGYLNSLPERAVATDPDLLAILTRYDQTVDEFAAWLEKLSSFGIPETGIGALYQQQQQLFAAVKSKLAGLAQRWQKNADDYALLVADPTPDIEKLQAMERLISTQPTPAETITLPIVHAKKTGFDTAFSSVHNAGNTNQSKLTQLIQQTLALDLKPFDLVSFDINTQTDQVYQAVYDMQQRAKTLADTINTKRVTDAELILATLGTLTPENQAKQIEAAARLILGDQFHMLPKYQLSGAQTAELANSWNAKNDLLAFANTTRTNPTEDWLHGIARVHEKMKHLENCFLLREAFGLTEADMTLHPTQFPFAATDYHWLALPYPATVDLEKGNNLLFTAVTPKAAGAPTEICGLLIDEWTELIPAKEETTGISFHYDRPNAESPQTLLLVTPTRLEGNWDWNDLVDALIYTLQNAKMRGVQPDQVDTTALAALLPAIVAPESLFPYAIVLDNAAHYKTIEEVRNYNQILN